MEQRSYSVRCDCGEPIRVLAGDAGSVAVCPCGRSLPVPSLSALRANASGPVEVDGESVPASEAAARRVSVNGWLCAAVGFGVTAVLFVALMAGLRVHPSARTLTIAWGSSFVVELPVQLHDSTAFALLATFGVMAIGTTLCGVLGWAVGKVCGGILNHFRPSDTPPEESCP